MSRWYRAHVGLVTDAKLAEAALIAGSSRALAIAAWQALLESCASVNDGGRYDTTPRRVAAILGEPLGAIEAVFAAFADLGMIAAGRVTAWTRRQFESDSSTERSRKHREAKRAGELMRGHAVEPATAPPTDATPVQRCATPPDSETDPDPPPLPFPPPAESEPIGDFAAYWRAIPSPGPAARAATLAAFARLSSADQAQAIAGAGRYAAAYAARPTTHPISPARFLRDRCFEGYRPPGAVAAAAVFVRVDSPQWRAWTAHRGKPIPLNRDGSGWHFPGEWPPQSARGAA